MYSGTIIPHQKLPKSRTTDVTPLQSKFVQNGSFHQYMVNVDILEIVDMLYTLFKVSVASRVEGFPERDPPLVSMVMSLMQCDSLFWRNT